MHGYLARQGIKVTTAQDQPVKQTRISRQRAEELLRIYLLKYHMEINSLPKPLAINSQIQFFIFIRNSGIVLSKMLEQANKIISFKKKQIVVRIKWKKYGLELL